METRIHTIIPPEPHPRRGEIREFVVDFYSEIRTHPVLGPVFNNKIGDHWESHFETLTDFWVTILFGVYAYKGNPFLAHKKTPGIEVDQFGTWLEIFEVCANRTLKEDLSALAIEKAGRIADSLRQGLFFKTN